jgi:RNA polymerase sigma-70 factor (ECF subfamily)
MRMNKHSALISPKARSGYGAQHLPMPFEDEILQDLRKDMVRFALLQLRNRELAEDVVQEALAAALTARSRYAYRASFKTWLFAILKNKIVDVARDNWQKKRVNLDDTALGDHDFDTLLMAHGQWHASEMPSSLEDPEQALETQQFWEVFRYCMDNMPGKTAKVFSMRVFLGMEVEEICNELGISESNCWVILHRARMALRLKLEKHWFGNSHKLV